MTPGQQALAEAARLEAARYYGHAVREHAGPPPTQVLAELLDALGLPPRPAPKRRLVPVTRVEQAIARGRSDAQIARSLDVSLDVVADVRAAMDRAAS